MKIEGKTKVVESVDLPNRVRITTKASLTANDAAIQATLPVAEDKTTQTIQVFHFLKQNGVPVAYISRNSDTSFIAWHCKMLPLECVIRRQPYGSYIKRHPEAGSSDIFNPPKTEFYHTYAVVIDGEEVGSEEDQLAVFVDGECRGYINGIYVPFTDSYIFPMMSFSNQLEERMSFDFYHAKEGKVYNDISVILFKNDMIVGDAIESYTINIDKKAFGPITYKLGDAYPNPFNPSTTIDYSIANEGLVNISIYDIKGALVEELVNEQKSIGGHKVRWIANNLSSGVYFVQIKAKDFVQTKKLILIK